MAGVKHHRAPRVVHDPVTEATLQWFALADPANSGRISATDVETSIAAMGPFAQGEMTKADASALVGYLGKYAAATGGGDLDYPTFHDAVAPLFNEDGQ